MLEYIRKLWKIEDLRKKIIYTFGMLLLFRLVGCIPAPGIDVQAVKASLASSQSNGLLDLMNMMTGGSLAMGTLFAEQKVNLRFNVKFQRTESTSATR